MVVAVVLISYAFFATGGSWRFRDGMGYFSALGDAFLEGHLYLGTQPPPELANDPNPFDAARRDALRARGVAIMPDASLFNGRYYLYWGPVPGVIHAAWRLVSRHELADSTAQVLAAVAMPLAFMATVSHTRSQYWPRAPSFIVWGSSIAFGLGGIMLFMVGRPSVYHEAILVGAAFLLPAWYFLLRAYQSDRRRAVYLLISGLLMGCAVGARLVSPEKCGQRSPDRDQKWYAYQQGGGHAARANPSAGLLGPDLARRCAADESGTGSRGRPAGR
jgi:hypothetical protein